MLGATGVLCSSLKPSEGPCGWRLAEASASHLFHHMGGAYLRPLSEHCWCWLNDWLREFMTLLDPGASLLNIKVKIKIRINHVEL